MSSSNKPTNRSTAQQMGRCRVCGNPFSLSELTEEHCPPKCCLEFLISEQSSIMKAYKPEERPKYKQKGIAFQKSTCKKCNNEILAKQYDPALLELCQKVKGLIDTKIIWPYTSVSIEVQPVAIMKGILGHLMAASKVYSDTWLDTLARKCVLEENEPIPDELHVFYWFYPYPEYAAVHRDFAMPSIRGQIASAPEVFATMKYFPVAFLVTLLPHYAGLSSLNKWRGEPLSARAMIPIDLSITLPKEWPDMVDDTNFIIVGQPAEYSVIATPRSAKK